jgi:hypothetical protein
VLPFDDMAVTAEAIARLCSSEALA